MDLSKCIYFSVGPIKTICNKPSNGSGFCEDHIKNISHFSKISMRVLNHCFNIGDPNLIERCINYYKMDQTEINTVLGFVNLRTSTNSNINHLFQNMLLSPKYFPEINNYSSMISIMDSPSKVIWWINKYVRHFILYKRFLITLWITKISKDHPGLIDLLPRFLDFSNN